MIRLVAVSIVAAIATTTFAQKEALHKKEQERIKLLDTRVDNNGYWLKKASAPWRRSPCWKHPPGVPFRDLSETGGMEQLLSTHSSLLEPLLQRADRPWADS